jgi:phosphomannomutase
LHQVASQCDPDPAFPTVKFPNPEEKGALDEAIKTANSIPTCSLIIANDPDADRLAVAEKGKLLLLFIPPLLESCRPIPFS